LEFNSKWPLFLGAAAEDLAASCNIAPTDCFPERMKVLDILDRFTDSSPCDTFLRRVPAFAYQFIGHLRLSNFNP